MTYLGEIRRDWRFLTAAGIGQAAGYAIVSYTSNIFTPHLITEFGWSRSDIALIGATAFLGILAQPIAGRLTDSIWRETNGDGWCRQCTSDFFRPERHDWRFLAFLSIESHPDHRCGGHNERDDLQSLDCQQFNRARGVALAIAACTPPAVAAAIIPFLSGSIDVHGWRHGYVVLGLYAATAGVIAVLLIPAGSGVRRSVGLVGRNPSRIYADILRNPAFKLIIAAIVLCNLSFTMQTSQLKVLLLDRGVDSATGSLVVSLFAVSVIVGRLVCGMALDRFPTYVVAAISLGLPGLGLGLLALGVSEPMGIAVAVLLLGFSLGAEGDVLAYVVMKYFRLEIYSTVLGMVLGAYALSVAGGSLLLSLMLELTESFTPFLVLTAISALIGAGALLLLRRVPAVR